MGVGLEGFFQVDSGFVKLPLANEMVAPTLVNDRLPLGNLGILRDASRQSLYQGDRPGIAVIQQELLQLFVGTGL